MAEPNKVTGDTVLRRERTEGCIDAAATVRVSLAQSLRRTFSYIANFDYSSHSVNGYGREYFYRQGTAER